MRILFAYSDDSFLNRISSLLLKQGCTVDSVSAGADCVGYAEFDIYDVIIIGYSMADIEGVSLIKEIRYKKISTPVLVIGSRRSSDDVVCALDAGADDFMFTPFSMAEFFARIRALARRKPMQLELDLVSYGDISLDLSTNELICHEHIVHLGIKEFQILKILISSGKNIISKEQLFEKVWGINSSSEYNNIEVYISFLRRKLRKLNSQVIINSVRSIGYILSTK